MKNFMKGMALLAAILAFTGASAQAAESVVVLSEKNVIVLNDAIMPDTMGEIMLNAKELSNAMDASLASKVPGLKKEPLYLFVNSPGGSIQTGLETIEALKGLGRPIHTVTLFAASMAFQFVQQFDTRYILKNGVMMSHQAYGGMEGEFGGFGPSQIDNRMGLWVRRLNEMDNQTVKRTNGKQTLESYQKSYAKELWRTGDESVKEGYSDKVIRVKCDETLDGVNNKHLDLFLGLVRITYDIDKCPTNTNPMNIQIQIRRPSRADREDKASDKKTETKPQSKPDKNGYIPLETFLAEGGDVSSIDPNLTVGRIKEAVQRAQYDMVNRKPLPMSW